MPLIALKRMLDISSYGAVKTRLFALARSVGIKDSVIVAGAMVFAGSLDYLVHIVVGRGLAPVEYGIFVAVTSLVQVLIFLSTTIRSVVGFYTAKLASHPECFANVSALVRQMWGWAWKWGLIGTATLALATPFLARQLHLPNSLPLWAAISMVLILCLRQVTHGVLQGIHQFSALGFVLVLQALLRVIFAVTFIWVGTRAVGALAAQTLSCAVAVAVAVWCLRPYFNGKNVAAHPISLVYPLNTFLGLATFGALTNLDPLFVKHYFSPAIAGNYGPVSTLAKVSLFLPWSLGLIILPKVRRRQAAGEDTRPILILGLLAALLPGLLLTTAYLSVPGLLVKTIFGNAYANPGVVLGLCNLAATLYAGLYIWLNYALALDRPAFIYLLILVSILQATAMFAFGRQSLTNLMLIMIACGAFGHVMAYMATFARKPVSSMPTEPLPSEQ